MGLGFYDPYEIVKKTHGQLWDDSYYIEDSKTLIFRSETGLFYQEEHNIVKKAEGYFIQTYDYNDKGGNYFFPAKGEAADLLAELMAK